MLHMRVRRRATAGNDESAVGREQTLAGFRFQCAPQLVRSLHQRRVVFALADREARDARVAVARAEGVRWREAIQAENARALLRQVIDRRAAHRAESQHDGIVGYRSAHATQRTGLVGSILAGGGLIGPSSK